MIEIKADSKKTENGREATVIIHIDADDKKIATKELYIILNSLDEKCPDVLMDAVDMHIKHIICDELFEEGGEE